MSVDVIAESAHLLHSNNTLVHFDNENHRRAGGPHHGVQQVLRLPVAAKLSLDEPPNPNNAAVDVNVLETASRRRRRDHIDAGGGRSQRQMQRLDFVRDQLVVDEAPTEHTSDSSVLSVSRRFDEDGLQF